MKKTFSFLAAVLLAATFTFTACGSDVCDDSCDKINELKCPGLTCNGVEGECDGANKALAECVVKATDCQGLATCISGALGQ